MTPRPRAATPSSLHATLTMRANRRSDTGPELRLRSLLHSRGLRFRVDRRLQAGDRRPRPDIVFAGPRVAVFVDGCFWHRCPAHGELPVSNREFWREKLERTVARDDADSAALTAAGWLVIRVWEHEDPATAADRVEDAVRGRLQPT